MNNNRWKAATMERPIIEALKKAYSAGQRDSQAGEPEAQEEMERAFKELVASGKAAMRSRTNSLGLPSGHMANMAAALWEFSYWWGSMSSQSKTAASEENILHETKNLYLYKTPKGLEIRLNGPTAAVVVGKPKDVASAKRAMDRLERYPDKLRDMYKTASWKAPEVQSKTR